MEKISYERRVYESVTIRSYHKLDYSIKFVKENVRKRSLSNYKYHLYAQKIE